MSPAPATAPPLAVPRAPRALRLLPLVRAVLSGGDPLERCVCRACLLPGEHGALTRLDASLQIHVQPCAGVYKLSDVLGHVTKSEVSIDGILPEGLCQSCLLNCTNAFIFLKTYEAGVKCLGSLVDYITRRVNTNSEVTNQVCIAMLPDVNDYNIFEDVLEKYISKPPDDLVEELSKVDVVKKYVEYVCKDCDNKFTTKFLYKKHRYGCFKIKYQCKLCDASYAIRNCLGKHVVEKHCEDKTQICTFCWDIFGSEEMLSHHLMKEHGNYTYESNIKKNYDTKDKNNEDFLEEKLKCGNFHTTKNKKQYKRHNATATSKRIGNAYNRYCKDCFMHFTNKILFFKHRRTHFAIRKVYKCEHCHYCVKIRKDFVRHVKKHGQIRTNTRINAKNDDVTENIKSTLEERDLIYDKSGRTQKQCEYCGKTFARKFYFERHRRLHESQMTLHKCKLCDYSTEKRGTFTEHVRRHKKNYTCEVCGKMYHRLSLLEKHKFVHQDGRPEICSICGESFRSKVVLTFHMRRHTGERPYKCDVCGEGFISSSRRGAHLRFKHGPRPQCEICKVTYCDTNILKKHMRLAHFGERKGLIGIRKADTNIKVDFKNPRMET